MNIRIICLGKIKEQSLLSLIEEYQKRISKYANFEMTELPDEPIKQNASQKEILQIQKIEADRIKAKIQPSDFVICLDQTGKQLSSEELSDKIAEITVKRF